MKKFKFRLQRVLDYRNSLKSERQRNLAMKQTELQRTEKKAMELEARHDENERGATECCMAEIAMEQQHLSVLRDALDRQRDLIAEAAKAVEEARDQYLERAIEAEMLESLKTKQRELFKEDLRKEKRKELNEITIQRFKVRGNAFKKGGKDE